MQEIDAAEEKHARLEMRAGAARQERRQLEAALEEVQLSCAAGQADLTALRKDLAALQAKVASPALKPLLPGSSVLQLAQSDNISLIGQDVCGTHAGTGHLRGTERQADPAALS